MFFAVGKHNTGTLQPIFQKRGLCSITIWNKIGLVTGKSLFNFCFCDFSALSLLYPPRFLGGRAQVRCTPCRRSCSQLRAACVHPVEASVHSQLNSEQPIKTKINKKSLSSLLLKFESDVDFFCCLKSLMT